MVETMGVGYGGGVVAAGAWGAGAGGTAGALGVAGVAGGAGVAGVASAAFALRGVALRRNQDIAGTSSV